MRGPPTDDSDEDLLRRTMLFLPRDEQHEYHRPILIVDSLL